MSQKDGSKEKGPQLTKEEEEKIRKLNEIFDKCDNEQLQDLEKSKHDYLVLIVQLRKVYRTRLGLLILIILCMFTIISMFILYRMDRMKSEEHFNSCKYLRNTCPSPPISCPTKFNEACNTDDQIFAGENPSFIVCKEGNRRLSIHPDLLLGGD
ncbi:unnamed protein product [Bursaphelenchus xylophilus]|uniref:(pine wood nematode) hypothetical protein n=1 Tax=Bursaphelenchus xylophilus TaxID=6326 RepID=A0A1I7RRP5_BURXY|nr:unnamed protein product [Bursaphelenchus xylophilus]CAG9123581.1 unnamed protein product [Bursaphelenchus xylophilus]